MRDGSASRPEGKRPCGTRSGGGLRERGVVASTLPSLHVGPTAEGRPRKRCLVWCAGQRRAFTHVGRRFRPVLGRRRQAAIGQGEIRWNAGGNRLSRLGVGKAEAPGRGRCVISYDLADRLTSIDYPDALVPGPPAETPATVDAATVTRGYDADDRLTSVEDWLDHETDFAYDVGDAMTSIQRRTVRRPRRRSTGPTSSPRARMPAISTATARTTPVPTPGCWRRRPRRAMAPRPTRPTPTTTRPG
jgi:hypothetical protein